MSNVKWQADWHCKTGNTIKPLPTQPSQNVPHAIISPGITQNVTGKELNNHRNFNSSVPIILLPTTTLKILKYHYNETTYEKKHYQNPQNLESNHGNPDSYTILEIPFSITK